MALSNLKNKDYYLNLKSLPINGDPADFPIPPDWFDMEIVNDMFGGLTPDYDLSVKIYEDLKQSYHLTDDKIYHLIEDYIIW